MRVLVTGTAGYIGSHAARALLLNSTTEVLGVDSLERGHVGAVASLQRLGGRRFDFTRLDLRDTAATLACLTAWRPDAILHFAGLAQVAESVAFPQRYEACNVGGTASVLAAAAAAGVQRFVLSSSAAVYGAPGRLPIREDAPCAPVNPYGETKLRAEELVATAAAGSTTLASAALRYFNVAGAAPDGSLGEDHRPETHLIPCALLAAAGRGPALTVHGDDWPTPDGTCIRDFVHVEDLVRAHLDVLDAMRPGECLVANVGTGHGHSVRQVIDAVERVVGHAVPRTVGPRRAGDPPALVADPARMRARTRWRPTHPGLDAMIADAWRWMQANPAGYVTGRS
jgi:UDP-glucose-4-epimerase GalE